MYIYGEEATLHDPSECIVLWCCSTYCDCCSSHKADQPSEFKTATAEFMKAFYKIVCLHLASDLDLTIMLLVRLDKD